MNWSLWFKSLEDLFLQFEAWHFILGAVTTCTDTINTSKWLYVYFFNKQNVNLN